MGKSVLTDAKAFSFKGLELGPYVTSWTDKLSNRIARHEYLKLDGAELEPMGNSPDQFTMRFCFTGPNWAKDYRNLVKSIQDDPKGLMVHPLFGNINVACEGIPDGSVNPGQAKDTIEFSLTFIANQLDKKLVNQSEQSVSAKEQQVSTANDTFSTASAAFSSAAVQVAALSSAALAYSSAAATSALTSTVDASTSNLLSDTKAATEAAVTAISADPLATSAAATFDAVAAAEQLYDACAQLDDAVRSQKPVIIEYVARGVTNLWAIATELYGPDGIDRADEIATNNRIPNPHKILTGTRLLVASPTV